MERPEKRARIEDISTAAAPAAAAAAAAGVAEEETEANGMDHDLVRRIKEVHRRAESVFAEKRSLEGTLGTEICPGVTRVCTRLLAKIGRTDKTPGEQNDLISLVHQQLDIITKAIKPDGQSASLSSSPLCNLSEDVLFTYLGPHLGTQATIGTLALTHPALHAPTTSPSMHKTVHVESDKPIPMTERQLTVWLGRFAETKRAVLLCPMRMGVVRLMEGLCKTLEHLRVQPRGLDFWEAEGIERIPYPRGPESPQVVFPRLAVAEVGSPWTGAAGMRNWKLTALREITVSGRASRASETAAVWLESSPHVWSLEVGDWELRDVADMLHRCNTIKRLTGVRITGRLKQSFRVSLPPVGEPDSRAFLKHTQLEELEATIDYGHNSPYGDRPSFCGEKSIQELDYLRKHNLAPNAVERYHTQRNGINTDTFRLGVLRQMHSEELADCAGTLRMLAALAAHVEVPDEWAWPQALVSSGAFSTLSTTLAALDFPLAERVSVVRARVGVGAGQQGSLPDVLLSSIGRLFPSVTVVEVCWPAVVGQAVMQAVMAQLSDRLEVVRFRCPNLSDALPPYFRGVTTSIAAFSIEGALSGEGVYAVDQQWSLRVEERGQAGNSEAPVLDRVRQMTIRVDVPDIEDDDPDWCVSNFGIFADDEGWFDACRAISRHCLAAVHDMPALDHIMYECTKEVGPGNDSEYGSRVQILHAKHVAAERGRKAGAFHGHLSVCGFEAVELPSSQPGLYCRIAVRRCHGVRQKKITDYFGRQG
ncbi:unnamed protein product [Vitrella brassicaformis CCMP3155]|uniref:Uncharacterized protein n=2 Tax=Vitrella brassicaformis TaxID=1169539 RepID=A0A0G4EEL9_VITBC|nr:unnamed protein product [Vitrella brassicaformis CCMP3155]|eukprot:CEL94121.1 unnamed protein product [Vitrella brassicaformis CCMP3155]